MRDINGQPGFCDASQLLIYLDEYRNFFETKDHADLYCMPMRVWGEEFMDVLLLQLVDDVDSGYRRLGLVMTKQAEEKEIFRQNATESDSEHLLCKRFDGETHTIKPI